jgi:uncharacterized protein (DUF305 family)
VNKKTSRVAIFLVLIPTVAVAAWQQGSHSHGAKAREDAGWTELMAGMDKMHAAMASVKPSRDSDVDFVKLMLPHHQAALDMAKAELMYGKDPQMRRLAQEIITDQQSEIELMHLWLKQHNPAESKPTTRLKS